MKVRVRYFALFREQTGCSAEAVEWPGGTAAELFQQMAAKHAGLTAESAALVAVNDEMANWESTLSDGDEVLFFPPVAGG
ncbi:MAG: MoaD/ThiS family protein [Xanthomonadales bacterium]|nr:MoaD/ThiS family protein [Gammaproteobacteria bacterium]NNK03239.1 MoaD/ThiS family protein [Xanthomonadales bacterium]